MARNLLKIDLEVGIQECLPELSDAAKSNLVKYLRKEGVLHFNHLKFMKRKKLADSGFVTIIQAARLLESCEEAISEAREEKERRDLEQKEAIREAKEARECRASEQRERRALNLKLFEIIHSHGQLSLELAGIFQRNYARSVPNYEQLMSEINKEDWEFIGGLTAYGAAAGGLAGGAAAGGFMLAAIVSWPAVLVAVAGAAAAGGAGAIHSSFTRDRRMGEKIEKMIQLAHDIELQLNGRADVLALKDSLALFQELTRSVGIGLRPIPVHLVE